MKKIVLCLSIVIASGLLFTNLYNSMVDVRSWGADIPSSVSVARAYYKSFNPGDFYRIFSPINQLLALVVLILFWKRKPARIYLAVALVLFVSADALTFAYFYPRNHILFQSASLTDVQLLKRTCQEWNNMNWFRSAICVAGLVCSFKGLILIFTLPVTGLETNAR